MFKAVIVVVMLAAFCSAQYADSLKPVISVLNYALSLEHLENVFYRTGIAQYSEADFISGGSNAGVYGAIKAIASHELAHVGALNSTIQSLGGTPVLECTYDFKITSVSNFLATAMTLENVGVTAYDGAVSQIAGTTYSQVAATIATVEARHAAFLNQINAQSAFPAAYDTAATSATVLAAAGPFIVSCPAVNSQCNGVASSASTVCNGKGTCANTVCTCTAGNFGVNCASTTAPTPTPTIGGSISADVLAFEVLKPNLITLNYALTLEHLENTFYRNGLAAFSSANFVSAGYDANVYNNFVQIGRHELFHAANLSTTITSLGGTPVSECTYNFNLTSVQAFVNTAANLENTGVAAYDGAISSLTNGNIAQTAATIATVEARHASYINGLIGQSGFPNSFDPTQTTAQILAATGPIFNVCPAANSQCGGVASTASTVCGGRGTCSFAVCTCSSGYVGNACQFSTTGRSSAATTTVSMVAIVLAIVAMAF